jgi:excisionase family DNA binding protein
MRLREAAKKLEMTEEEILELIEKGLLQARKRGKGWSISAKSIEEYLEATSELREELKEFVSELKETTEKMAEELKWKRELERLIEEEGEFAFRDEEDVYILLTATGRRYRIDKKTGEVERF